MATTLVSTGVQFPDGTVQTTASGASTAFSIGSYVIGRPANVSNYAVNSTIAGSSLYAVPAGVVWPSFYGYFTGIGFGDNFNSTTTLVNTGTWRCLSPASSAGNTGYVGAWVRIS